jgi:undecaprenyl-diphosphatase
MDQLLQLDLRVFELINQQGHFPFFDWLMPYWREKSFWIPLYLVLTGFVIYRFRRSAVLFLLMAIATIGVADTVSSRVVKPTVQRLRPCNDPQVKENVALLIPCGPGYSFTSSHATNHFALATFLALTLGMRYRRMIVPLYLWAFSIAYGQVYVGVHYPLDILAGGLLGIVCGWIVYRLYLFAAGKKQAIIGINY